jgi:hypothetical protein
MAATFQEIFRALDFWGWMAVIAIGTVLIEAVVRITRMWIKHRERMAMIAKGMHPGPQDPAYEKDKV